VPPDEAAWEESVQAFQRDLQEMIKLVKKPEKPIYCAAIPHGDGQNDSCARRSCWPITTPITWDS